MNTRSWISFIYMGWMYVQVQVLYYSTNQQQQHNDRKPNERKTGYHKPNMEETKGKEA